MHQQLVHIFHHAYDVLMTYNAPSGLVDSHFHILAMQSKGIEITSLLQQLTTSGFAGGIDVGVSCDDLGIRTSILAGYPTIMRSAGIGPWGVEDGSDPMTVQLETLVSQNETYGADYIGEIGLDNYWKYGTVELQERLFIQQIELADQLKLPIIIHNREADAQTTRILKEHAPTNGGILHCFSGSDELADIALELGLYISFAGPITYKRNIHLREILARIPADRLLLETDSPYLSPEPYRGTVNTPLRMENIYAEAAAVRNTTSEELAMQLQKNLLAVSGRDTA